MVMTMYELFLTHSRGDRELRTVVNNQLEPIRITLMQWLLLGVVASGPKQGVSMSDIANTLGITLPQVTALMTELSKGRYVKLKTQKHDRRSRHALLTPKGDDLFHEAEKNIESALMELFPETERQAYAGALEKLGSKISLLTSESLD